MIQQTAEATRTINPPQAMGDQIIVIKDPYKPTSVGGILIPEIADRTPRFSPTIFATVHSCGRRVVNLKSGMRIALKIHCGDEFEYDGKQYSRMRERDIAGMAQ